MISTAVRDFCIATREATVLKEEARLRCREANQQKAASKVILQELLQGATPQGYVTAAHDGTAYRVRLRTKTLSAPPKTADAAAQRILELWEQHSEDLEKHLTESGGVDPAGAIVEYVIQNTTRRQISTGQQKQLLEVLPYKPKVQEGTEEAPPPAPVGVEELVASYVTAKAEASNISKEAKENRRPLEEKCIEAQEKLLEELDSLPEGRAMQRVNLRDSEGNTESFYIRVKPPRKTSGPVLGIKAYRAALKAAVEDVVTRFCVDSYRAPTIVPRAEFGQELSEAVKKTVESVVVAKPVDVKRRVAFDRVKKTRKVVQ